MPWHIMCHIDVSFILHQSMGKMTNWVIDTYSHIIFFFLSCIVDFLIRYGARGMEQRVSKTNQRTSYVFLCNNEKITTFETQLSICVVVNFFFYIFSSNVLCSFKSVLLHFAFQFRLFRIEHFWLQNSHAVFRSHLKWHTSGDYVMIFFNAIVQKR